MALKNEGWVRWNILIGILEALKDCSSFFFVFIWRESLALFHSERQLFSSHGSLTRSGNALGRDYGDLKPLLLLRFLPVVFLEADWNIMKTVHQSIPLFIWGCNTVAAIGPVGLWMHARDTFLCACVGVKLRVCRSPAHCSFSLYKCMRVYKCVHHLPFLLLSLLVWTTTGNRL